MSDIYRSGTGANDGTSTPYLNHKPKENVLEEAMKIVKGSRNEAYGPPTKDFKKVAAMWTILFGFEVKATQIGPAMIALKLCRETNKHKRDNFVDIAGYALCSENVAEDIGNPPLHPTLEDIGEPND